MNDKLCEALKEQARRIGPSPTFWEQMTSAILAGQVKGLDPRIHLRNPKPIAKICAELHELLGSPDGKYSEIKPELKALYLTIVKRVLELLDYVG